MVCQFMVYLLQFFDNLAMDVLGLDYESPGCLFHIKDAVITVRTLIRQYETFLYRMAFIQIKVNLSMEYYKTV